MPNTMPFRKYNTVIRELGWATFTDEPMKLIIPLVREFYANIHRSTNNWVDVFGTRVNFGANSINEALGIRRILNVDLLQRLKNGTVGIDIYEVQHRHSLGKGVTICRPPYTCSI